MKLKLFWRLFSAFVLITLITVVLVSGVTTIVLQQERLESYEKEVRMQAREVAEYMAHLDQLSSVRQNATMQYIVRRKIEEVHSQYNADIWIVSYSSGKVQYIDSSWNTATELSDPDDALIEQLAKIQSGEEIRAQGLFEELGSRVVTIGVPWRFSEGEIVGAVLLHIGAEELSRDYLQVLGMLGPATLVALLLGVTVSWFLARSQTKPLKEINSAVRDFAKGKFERRVRLTCGGELRELGESFNSMADELDQLEQSRRSFVANVSHELRSPMTSMRGYVQGMLDGTIPPGDQAKYLGVVMDETRRLTDLVRDLLDLSKYESGKFPMRMTDFNVNELIGRTLISFEQRIEGKNIDVQVDFETDQLYVHADADRISQVVSNLIDNAVKFLPGEGGVLNVGARREGKCVRVWVKDNGSGISQEDLPHVFDRFYKADKAHTFGMGTGLGLSIVKRILQQHARDISVRSASGETIFEFCLTPGEMPEKTVGDGAESPQFLPASEEK